RRHTRLVSDWSSDVCSSDLAAQRMMADGTVAELTRLKRLDARVRQKLAVDRLSGFEIQTNEKSYHLWLTLPAHWRSQTFVAAARSEERRVGKERRAKGWRER